MMKVRYRRVFFSLFVCVWPSVGRWKGRRLGSRRIHLRQMKAINRNAFDLGRAGAGLPDRPTTNPINRRAGRRVQVAVSAIKR